MTVKKNILTKQWLPMAGLPILICFLLSCICACSEEDATVDEFDNWQQRNEQFFASLQDSLSRGGASWMRIKKFSLDPAQEGQPTDYIYVHKLEQGTETDASPMYTDSVRVSYQGRLIPTTSHPDGYVFDSTVYGNYDAETASTACLAVSGVVDGFSTALQHMHRGDYWRIFIPQNMGYGATAKTGIPSYSTLIFDIRLVDFSSAGKSMAPWKAPRR